VIVPIKDDSREFLVGLSAAHVSQIRELKATPQSVSDHPASAQPYLGPLWVDRGEVLRLIDLDRLLPQSVRSHLIDVSAEASG
jgi:chemotaxis signal transduction protein